MGSPAVDAPTAVEAEKLASMRDELLREDWAYWHDDHAILYLNRILGEDFPPYRPDGLD